MAERLHTRTGFVMALPRSPHLLGGAIAGLGSALWLNVVGPLAGLVAAWGALAVVNVLAVALIAVLAMLMAAAGGLVAADWRADAESRRAWAQIDPAGAEFSPPVNLGTPLEIDPRYLPAVDSEALRRVFRAHRFTSPAPALQTITQVPAAVHATRMAVAAAEAIPAPTMRDAEPEITCNQGISATVVSEVDISGRGSRKLASTIPAEAPTIVASRRRLPLALRAGRAAPRIRLVANTNIWSGSPARDECILTRTPPSRHTADVVVLSSSRDDRTQPLPNGSTRGNIARSTEPPSCRGPPQVVGRRSRATETTSAARQVPAAGTLPPADPVVRDNLGHPVPVCAVELDVIETYLDQALRDLLGSPTTTADQEKA